jgi:core-2/I-Branching enzyme
MKIAYLLFAYKNPQLLERLITRLSTEDSAFFIHIDKKVCIRQFSRIRGGNVYFTEERIPVYWAEFSGIEAILLLLRQALASEQHYDYFVLLSGSDYPLRSAKYIQSFLQKNRGTEFVSLVKVPAPGKPLSRINTFRFPSTKPVRRFVTRALAKVGLVERDYRKYLGTLEAYAGNTWWALTGDACRYIVEFSERNQHVSEFFYNVFAPEEAFFHTILGNSAFKSHIRKNLLFEDWSAQGAHPEMINGHHILFFEGRDAVCTNDEFGDGEFLFARKFCDENIELLERIDEMIKRKDTCSSPFSSQRETVAL